MNEHHVKTPDLLVVDDDVTFSETLGRALTRRGHTVAVANTVDDAIKIIDAEALGYAVIDLCIGTESGLPLVDRCARRDPEIRVIVLTGYASIATAVEAIKLGATHYLTKPASADEIHAALNRGRGDAEIPTRPRPMSVRRLEWEHIQKVLSEHGGNVSAAARAMGMHRRTLQRKLHNPPGER